MPTTTATWPTIQVQVHGQAITYATGLTTFTARNVAVDRRLLVLPGTKFCLDCYHLRQTTPELVDELATVALYRATFKLADAPAADQVVGVPECPAADLTAEHLAIAIDHLHTFYIYHDNQVERLNRVLTRYAMKNQITAPQITRRQP